MMEATPMTELAELLTRTRVQPRPYQERIVTKAIDLFTRQGLRSVLIESPVGSGKTVMGLLTAKLMHKTIQDAGIARLIQDGFLSSYHHYTLPRYTPESVVETYCREPRRWGATLVYFHTLEQCRHADALLKSRGVRSDVVTGSSDREAQLDAFQEGKLDVLLNCLVLNEGFNFPGLKTVFCRPSTRGVTIQMCGRVLRTHPTVPVKQIVQCKNTPWPFPRTALPQQQFTWTDGSWRSLTANPRINEINSRILKALARTGAGLPQLLRTGPRQQRARITESTSS